MDERTNRHKETMKKNRKNLSKIDLTIIVVSLYLLAQIIADVTAFKMVEVFGFTVPAAVFIYALTFTNRDLAHKQLGYKSTITLVWAAAIVNVLMAAYFIFTIYLPSPVWFEHSEAYALVLGIVPRIVAASITAELFAQLLDTVVYQKWWERFPKAPQWTRVLVSNAFAIPLDSLVFVFIAFYGNMPMLALWAVVLGQMVMKMAITIVSLPLIYVIPQNPKYTPGDPEYIG
jgi:queuosine precursor transporter